MAPNTLARRSSSVSPASLAVAALLAFAVPAAADDRPIYANPVLGYRVALPEGDWTFVRNPPFPLTDLVIFSPVDESNFVVHVDRAEAPAPTLEEGGLADAAAAWKASLLGNAYEEAGDVEARFEEFRGLPSYLFAADATAKGTLERRRLSRRFLVKGNVLFFIDTKRPAGAGEATVRGLENAERTFEFYEPAEIEGGRFSPRGQFFTVPLPEGWTVAESKSEGEIFRARLAGPQDALLSVEVARAPDEELLKEAASKSLAEFLVGSAGTAQGPVATANEKGIVTYGQDYAAGGRRGKAWVFAKERRLYKVRAEGGAARVLYEGLELLRDLSVDLEPEREAEREEREGERLYYAGDFERAAVHFERSLKSFSRNADARVFLGLIAYRAERWDEALLHLRGARALFPVSDSIQTSFARSALLAGHAALSEKPPDLAKARERFADAAPVAKRLGGELAEEAGIAWNAMGVQALSDGRYTQAADYLEKAIEVHDIPLYHDNLASIYFNEAVELANKGNIPRAKDRLRAALKAKPDFAEAMEALAKLGGR
ncbi:MAG: tetratricopeptide repeat protein [Planctomycetes bacterium]|nr:tetratricopeptide repeat protein [Planctomycetota bacterium]